MSEDKTVVVDTRVAVARERFIAALNADVGEAAMSATGYAVVDALEEWIRAIREEKKARPKKAKKPAAPPMKDDFLEGIMKGVRLVASDSPPATANNDFLTMPDDVAFPKCTCENRAYCNLPDHRAAAANEVSRDNPECDCRRTDGEHHVGCRSEL